MPDTIVDLELRKKLADGTYKIYHPVTKAGNVKLKNGQDLETQMGDITSHSTYKLNKDSNDIFTEVQHKRANGTLISKSVLSGGTSPKYATRTLTKYASNGTTVEWTKVYKLIYDAYDNLISEVLQ